MCSRRSRTEAGGGGQLQREKGLSSGLLKCGRGKGVKEARPRRCVPGGWRRAVRSGPSPRARNPHAPGRRGPRAASGALAPAALVPPPPGPRATASGARGALGQRRAAASAVTKRMASMLHFPEVGKRPTRSAWAVNTSLAITSSLETRRDRGAGMSAGNRARREGRGAAAT